MRTTCAYGISYAVAALALCLLPVVACDQQRPVIHVQLNGLTSAVTVLSVSGTLDGRSLDGQRRKLDPAAASFDVFLQPGDTGMLALAVGGIADTGCQIGAGTSLLTITGADSYDATITLSYDAQNQGCQLIVGKSGQGSGQLRDATGSIFCDFSDSATTQCADTYPLDTQLTLSAAALEGSYFAGWTGACSGTSSCTITITAQPQNVHAGLLKTKLCTGSICWEHPLPQGSSLTSIFGVTSADIWMVGEEGALLHWNGVYTEAASSPNSAILHSVWGSATASVWAVGDSGAILRWDGSSWTTEQSPTGVPLYGVWGSSADSVWAVGDAGTILFRSSGSWTAQSSGTTAALTSLWGRDASNLWAVGAAGTVLKWSRAAGRNC